MEVFDTSNPAGGWMKVPQKMTTVENDVFSQAKKRHLSVAWFGADLFQSQNKNRKVQKIKINIYRPLIFP